MTLRAPAAVPPIVLPADGDDDAAVPAVAVAQRDDAGGVGADEVALRPGCRPIPSRTPPCLNRLITSPCTVFPPAVIRRPAAEFPADAPLNSMRITALSPSPGPLVLGLAPGCE